MREHLGFLKVSSAVVKTAAWIFLLAGIIGGGAMMLGFLPGSPRWAGMLVLAAYTFAFFFFFVIAKIADLLISIIHEIKKE